MTKRKSLVSLLPAVAVATGAGTAVLTTQIPLPPVIATAQAQTNPCGPANPCAPDSPCAPAEAQGEETGDKAAKATPTAESPADNPFDVPAGYTQAAYGDAMPGVVTNYLRAAPYVGTGGVVSGNGYAIAKALGFKTVISLNTAKEGAEDERKRAENAELNFVNVPVSERAPASDQVERIAEVVNDPSNYPILMHCQSSNRVGAAWALYRAAAGIPAEIAVQEGRTVGLQPSREGAVREVLGMDPLPTEG
ncbi:MAG: fused DSP-PTPase phosphatase/NAD kinase-like protein [Dichotomicrobium sp.]